MKKSELFEMLGKSEKEQDLFLFQKNILKKYEDVCVECGHETYQFESLATCAERLWIEARRKVGYIEFIKYVHEISEYQCSHDIGIKNAHVYELLYMSSFDRIAAALIALGRVEELLK